MSVVKNRYSQIIERIFSKYYGEGIDVFEFTRKDIEQAAAELSIDRPKNLGDVVYSFRYRANLPQSIRAKAREGNEWIIRPAGPGKYQFVLVKEARFRPNENMLKIKIPDATPGIVAKYSVADEQALLAKIRYNRLVDIFTGITCYSLQNHLRTTLPNMGQVETDEVYVGLDKQGAHYIFPIQAKGGTDQIGAVQIEQDFLICREKYPDAIGRPLAAQFLDNQTIVLFEFALSDEGLKIASEKHYRLVQPDELTTEEIKEYQKRVSS